jgi:hypothetical protein
MEEVQMGRLILAFLIGLCFWLRKKPKPLEEFYDGSKTEWDGSEENGRIRIDDDSTWN